MSWLEFLCGAIAVVILIRYYAGVTPHIVIHDPDILREIFIKQFSNFPNRRNQFLKVGGRYMNNAINTVRGTQWKRIRSTLSPSFSSGKLRQMTAIVESCTEKTICNLKNNSSGVFNPKKVIGELAMDVICSAAFGVDLHMSSEASDQQKEHMIITMSRKLLNMTFRSPKIFLLFIFPWLENYAEFLNISVYPSDMMNYYAGFVNAMIKQRRSLPLSMKRMDLMQLMLDAEVDAIDIHSAKGLSRDEIIGNAIFMLLAGNDTTGSTMSFLLYNLSTHQDIQDKLATEIDEIMKNDGKITYENIGRIKLLDTCIKETLRMYTPTFRNSRCGHKDITINGVFIPKDVIIDIPLYEIHHDPEIWDEPFKFRPGRFDDMSVINPMHYHPFGAGPRNCIGMRFAVMEIKLIMCMLLQNFRFEVTPQTPIHLKPIFKTLVQPPDMELKAICRNL